MNKAAIDVTHLKKTFGGITALDDVSMRFETGHLYGVIGPAGAGKTTLFRLILRLLEPDIGQITYLQNNHPQKFDAFRDKIAYMPQTQSLYADLSVDEHLSFFKELYGINQKVYTTKRDELLHMTRLDKFLNRPAGNLSGGMYKKLGLMCALLRSPEIMLLDEPTNGVDPISRREFWQMLQTAVNQNILVVMSTAYMDEAERCGAVVLMENGRVLGAGEPQKLLADMHADNFDDYFLNRKKGLR